MQQTDNKMKEHKEIKIHELFLEKNEKLLYDM